MMESDERGELSGVVSVVGVVGGSIEEKVERPKRPLGLTVIAIVWLLGGLYNLYASLQTIGTDLGLLPFLSLPTVPEWFRFGVPAELAISFLVTAVGLVQLFTIYGLWTGKSWSYKLALAIPLLAVVLWISQVGLYASAPVEYGLSTALPWGGLVGSLIFTGIYWGYLRQSHVKEYLGILPVEERRPPSPI